MLLLFEFLLVIFLVVFLILSIKIKIEIEDFSYNLNEINNKINNKINYKTNKNYNIKIIILILNKIPIIKVSVDKNKIDKIKKYKNGIFVKRFKEKIKKENEKRRNNKYNIKKEMKIINKHMKFKVKDLNLKVLIGTKNVNITTFLVAFLGIVISYLFLYIEKCNNCKSKNQCRYIIRPKYNEKNMVKINLNCIIEIKLIHIISTICIIKKIRRVDKNERTSNRKYYDYSYE